MLRLKQFTCLLINEHLLDLYTDKDPLGRIQADYSYQPVCMCWTPWWEKRTPEPMKKKCSVEGLLLK